MRSNKIKRLERYTGEQAFPSSNGAHKDLMTTVVKQKANHQKTYVKKPIFNHIDPYIASIEAIAAELYRFIGSIEITPKVRIIAAPNTLGNDKPIAIISEKIDGFRQARLHPAQIGFMLKNTIITYYGLYRRLFTDIMQLPEKINHHH